MPDTASYLNLGLVVVFAISGFYVFSLWLRLHNTAHDMHILDQLED